MLEDPQALERMIDSGMIERGVRRIGAEQELFLVDDAWQPLPRQSEVLAALADTPGSYTPELARFNIEANLQPLPLSGRCLSDMHMELESLVMNARAAARGGLEAPTCGILLTLHQEDLGLDSMADSDRYRQLNRISVRHVRRPVRVPDQGPRRARVEHDNVMMEACNTSFQPHFQVSDQEFANLYNLAQLTAPVLAAAVNSPVLLQHRLWYETRVALFTQSLDIRNATRWRATSASG